MVLAFTGGAATALFRWFLLHDVTPAQDAALLLGLIIAGGAWLLAQCGMASSLLHSSRMRGPAREQRDAHYREGMVAFLRDELDAAEAKFKAALRLDPGDVDSMLQLGTILKARGQRRRARRMFKKCRSRDLEGKWEWEISRELSEL